MFSTENKDPIIHYCKLGMYLSSFFYYILDNLVFYFNIGLLSEHSVNFLGIKIKDIKNLFSLTRNLIKIIYDLELLKRRKAELDQFVELIKIESIKNDKESDCKLKSILFIKNQINMCKLGVCHNIIRIVICLSSLKCYPINQLIHPIFAKFLGLIHCIITFYKEISELSGNFCENDEMNLLKNNNSITKANND